MYYSIFKKLAKENIPILWHVGDPETFWHREQVSQYVIDSGWFYGDGTFVDKETLYREVDAVLEKNPGLNIIFAHLLFLSADVERADRFLEKHPNLCFDITPGSEMYGNFSLCPEDWRAFFIKHQDQIVFGTDGGWTTGEGMRKKIDDAKGTATNVRRFLETDDSYDAWDYQVKGVKLPKEVLEKILSKNFLRIVGEKPRAVNLGAVCAYCDALCAAIETAEITDKESILQRASEIKKCLRELQ